MDNRLEASPAKGLGQWAKISQEAPKAAPRPKRPVAPSRIRRAVA